jgi:hypothetical protein
MLLFSFKDLEGDNTAKTLLSKYKVMAHINVPIFYVKKDDKRGQFKVVFNSLNDSTENRVHVYISNDAVQELAAKVESKSDDNGVKYDTLKIGYKGAALNTATCLQLHFD